MKGFLKFLALAVAGFALGAGAAWLQQPHGATPSIEAPKQVAESPVVEEKKPEAAAPSEGDNAPAPAASTADAASALTAPAAGATDNASDKAEETAEVKEEPNATEPLPGAAVSPEVQKNMAAAKGEPPPADAGIGGAFSLTDHNGKAVTEKSWPGKYLLVFFGFTNCPDVCPVTLDKLTSALNQLGDDAAKIQPLFITVDPSRDRANVMKEYVGHFHKSILGLTGTEAQIKAAEDAYKVFASRHDEKSGQQYTFDHSAFVYFMAPDGKMAEIIKTGDKASDIADKIRPHLDEAKQPETPAP